MSAPSRGQAPPRQAKTGKDYSPGNIPRDQWDRPLIVPPEHVDKIANAAPAKRASAYKTWSEPYVRASSLGGAVEYKGNLEEWKIRGVLHSVAREEDLLLRVQSIPDPHADASTKRTMSEIIKSAEDRGGMNSAATLGSALHDLGDLLDRGEEIPKPIGGQVRATLAAYQRVVTAHFRIVRSEAFVAHDGIRAAGTFDRQGELLHPMRPVDKRGKPIGPWIGAGESVIVDVKTSQKADYFGSKFGVQCLTYAEGDLYEVDDEGIPRRVKHGARTDWALILHVPSGLELAELYWVDLRRYRSVAEACIEAREADKRGKAGISPYADVAPPSQGALLAAINGAQSYAHLVALHEETGGLWGPDLIEAASARMAAVGGPS